MPRPEDDPFRRRLARLIAGDLTNAIIATDEVRSDALLHGSHGGSREELAMFEEVKGRFKTLIEAVLSELERQPKKHRNRNERTARLLLADAAAEFREAALPEPVRAFSARMDNYMAERAGEFEELLEEYWAEYRGGLSFSLAAEPSRPWHHGFWGALILGVLIGLIVAGGATLLGWN